MCTQMYDGSMQEEINKQMYVTNNTTRHQIYSTCLCNQLHVEWSIDFESPCNSSTDRSDFG